MISRRNIRIKVMQTLYALETSKVQSENGEKNAVYSTADIPELKIKGSKLLSEKFEQSSMLLSLMLQYIVRIAQYAETDAKNRAAKFLPTEDDKNVNTKVAGNEFVWALLENESFKEKVKKENFESKIENDKIKSLYQLMAQLPAYQSYIVEESRTTREDKQIFETIWKELLLESEDFNAYIADEYEFWEDDKDMVKMLIENFLKNKSTVNFLNFVSSEKREYAISLLNTVIEKDVILMDFIIPKLKNWDPERVAQIDLILLKMGIAEFLYFPTIPTKVTINEYIEIAKTYSTLQSGQFINGVLDNILKTLTQENKVRKVARP